MIYLIKDRLGEGEIAIHLTDEFQAKLPDDVRVSKIEDCGDVFLVYVKV